jgi:lysophospholipase L1-like esterase
MSCSAKPRLLFLFLMCQLIACTPHVIVWTAIGDSITYLNDHLDETGNRVSSGYLSRVVSRYPNIKYVNQGHNGWTAVGIAKEIETLGLVKSDVFSVLLGTNDWWSGLPLGTMDDYKNNTGLHTTYGSYRIIIDKIRSLNPGAKIILITPLQRTDFVYIADPNNNAFGCYKPRYGQALSQFANAVKEIGSLEHFPVIDLYNESRISVASAVKFKKVRDSITGQYRDLTYPEYIGIPFHPGLDEYPYPLDAIGYTYDGLHPSDLGNQEIANQIIVQFREAGYISIDRNKK